ncbi:ATP-binding protein [Aeromonas veronii]|uniref:ATP-binding protein n=1 Tax=Aeromonas veronii TaxID=654 RepID=UPI002715257F|nr:transporter substrate-binding domain-containing protein [Aeromonas veronii]WLD19805.1 transporter substrate-binding domain-containing protein [Aeromonas veronii]
MSSIICCFLLLISGGLLAESLSLGPRAFSYRMEPYLKDDFANNFQQALSVSQKKWLAEKKELRVGIVGPLTPPFEFITSKDNFEGMAADLLSILSLSAETKLTLLYYDDQSDALQAIAKNEVDMLNIDSILPEKNLTLSDYGWFTKEVINSGYAYLIGPDNASYSNLNRAVLSYEKNAYSSAELKQLFPDATLTAYDSAYFAYDAVLFGEADFFVGNRLVSRYLNGSRFGNLVLKQKLSIKNKPMSFFVGKEHAELLAILNTFSTVFQRSGLYSGLDLRWRGGAGSEPLSLSRLIRPENYAELIKRGVRVGLIKDNVPFSFLDEKGQWHGIIIDVLQHISFLTNLEFTEVAYSQFDDAEIGLLENEVDVIGSIPAYSSRTDLLTSLYYNADDTLVIIEADIKANSDTNNYGVSGSNFNTVKKSVLGESTKNQFQFFDTDLDVIRHFESGQIDLAIVSIYSAEYYRKLSSRRFHITRRLNDDIIERVFAVRPDDQDLLALINGALSHTSPSYLSSLAYQWRYGPKPRLGFYAQYGHIVRPVLWVIGPALCIYLYYSYRLARALRFKKKAEMSLFAQLDMMQRFLDGIPHPVALLSNDLICIYCNKAFYDDFGQADFFNKHLSNFVTKPDELIDVLSGINSAISTNEVVGKDSHVTISGTRREIQEWFIPYKDIDTGVTGGFWGWFDVTWRTQAYANVLNAKHEAELANQAKSEFIATISHEIRTPINIISGFLEIFYKTKLLSDSDREDFEYVRTAASGLLELVGDVLDITKIESGLMTLEIQPTDIEKLLREAVEVFYTVAEEKNIQIQEHYSFNTASVIMIDPLRVRQVFYNILSNAVKFTHHGHVLINAGIKDNVLFVSVSDSGIGISADKIAELFQPFRQAHIDPNRQGSGLGLNICKRLCQLMGGDIAIESQPGEGTTVSFSLPCQPAAASAVDLQANDDVCPVRKPDNLALFKILIVDDHPVNLVLLERQLSFIGFTVIKASSGQQVLDLLSQEHVDVILTDCQMPIMDGYELAHNIREYEQNYRLNKHVILGLTASGLKQDRLKALKSGMDDCFFKPIDTAGLQKAITPYLFQNTEVDIDDYSVDEDSAADQNLRLLVRETCLNDIKLAYAALAIADFKTTSSLIHRIKGVYLMLKHSQIVSLCISIEQELVNDQNVQVIENKIREIEDIVYESAP